MKMSPSLLFPGLQKRRAVSGAWTTCSVKGKLADLPPVPFPAVPTSATGGKFLRKVKVVLARPPEIPNVRALGWEGPENNAGAVSLADKDAVGQARFQAALQSLASAWRPAPDPGPGAGFQGPIGNLAPGCSQQPHLASHLLTAFGSWGSPLGAP